MTTEEHSQVKAIVMLPIALEPDDRDEAEVIVRTTRSALYAALRKIDTCEEPHIPSYARSNGEIR